MDMTAIPECPKNAIRNNETQRCDCINGYTGATCKEKCDNGTYGFACGRKCECPLEECHFESGCLNKTGNVTIDSMTSMRKWSTAAWTMRYTSTKTQVQPEGKVTIDSMTSTRKWSTATWTMSDTSTDTQVQPEAGVLVPTVIAVVSVTSVVIGLLIVYCFCLKKRKRNREEECHASGNHFILQERSYTVNEENVQSVVEESFKPSECLCVGEAKCLQTCSLHTVTSNKDNETSQEKHVYDTQEGNEGHYNTLLLRTGLYNQNNDRYIDEADTYSHIKALEGPTDVLLMEQYDHVNVVFNT